MTRQVGLLLVAVGLSVAGTATVASSQDKDFQAKGEIKIGQHKVAMTAGELYIVKIVPNGFHVDAEINPGFLPRKYLPLGDDQPPNEEDRNFEATFMPVQTQVHVISIVPNVFNGELPEGPLKYELTVKRVSLNKTPLLEKKAELTANDPKLDLKDVEQKAYYKSYVFKFKAGHTYVIDMAHTNDDSRMRDPYLVLEDGDKKIVAQDDDGGGELNARIIFEARKAGDYRILATTFEEDDVGEFTLTVRESVKK